MRVLHAFFAAFFAYVLAAEYTNKTPIQCPSEMSTAIAP